MIDWMLITTIIGPIITIMIWIHTRIEKRFDKIDQRFDRIDSDIKELRTGLNRIEGAFYAKDCCILKEDRKENKTRT